MDRYRRLLAFVAVLYSFNNSCNDEQGHDSSSAIEKVYFENNPRKIGGVLSTYLSAIVRPRSHVGERRREKLLSSSEAWLCFLLRYLLALIGKSSPAGAEIFCVVLLDESATERSVRVFTGHDRILQHCFTQVFRLIFIWFGALNRFGHNLYVSSTRHGHMESFFQ